MWGYTRIVSQRLYSIHVGISMHMIRATVQQSKSGELSPKHIIPHTRIHTANVPVMLKPYALRPRSLRSKHQQIHYFHYLFECTVVQPATPGLQSTVESITLF